MPSGNLVRHWGGPGSGYDWPTSNHGIFVDHLGQRLDRRQRPRRFAHPEVHQGRQVSGAVRQARARAAGRTNAQGATDLSCGGSNDPANFGRVAKIFVDPKTNEAYIADGYLNKRVAVLDAQDRRDEALLGRLRQQAGRRRSRSVQSRRAASQAVPQSRALRRSVERRLASTSAIASNDRLQVFRPDGTFVKEAFIAKNTRASGSVWDVAFSQDPQQRYLYVADGMNNRVYVLQRDTLEVLTSFGDGGRQPGQFYGVHSIAIDSKGNIYTTETWEGKRVQKFVFKGVGPVAQSEPGHASGRDRRSRYRSTAARRLEHVTGLLVVAGLQPRPDGGPEGPPLRAGNFRTTHSKTSFATEA